MVSINEGGQLREIQRQETAGSMVSCNGHPLYEVVGELERFDERDNVFARSALKPGSPEYQAYYARYPEREKPDSHCRVRMDPVQGPRRRAELFPEEPLARAFSGAVGLTAYLLADHLDGPVSPERVEIEPAVMSCHLKAVGRYLGADEVRRGLPGGGDPPREKPACGRAGGEALADRGRAVLPLLECPGDLLLYLHERLPLDQAPQLVPPPQRRAGCPFAGF